MASRTKLIDSRPVRVVRFKVAQWAPANRKRYIAMARVFPTRRWLLVKWARARRWVRLESAPARRWLLVASAPARRWLLVELARAKVVWPDIKSTIEFWVALVLFVVCVVAIAVLGLASR